MARWLIRHTHPTSQHRFWNYISHRRIIFISTKKRKLNIWHSKYTFASHRKDTIIVYINQHSQIGERNLVENKYFFFMCYLCFTMHCYMLNKFYILKTYTQNLYQRFIVIYFINQLKYIFSLRIPYILAGSHSVRLAGCWIHWLDRLRHWIH